MTVVSAPQAHLEKILDLKIGPVSLRLVIEWLCSLTEAAEGQPKEGSSTRVKAATIDSEAP